MLRIDLTGHGKVLISFHYGSKLGHYVNSDHVRVPVEQKTIQVRLVNIGPDNKPSTLLMAAEVACNSKDQFNKAEGRKLALKKLLAPETCELTREQRRQVWQAYWTRGSRPPYRIVAGEAQIESESPSV